MCGQRWDVCRQRRWLVFRNVQRPLRDEHANSAHYRRCTSRCVWHGSGGDCDSDGSPGRGSGCRERAVRLQSRQPVEPAHRRPPAPLCVCDGEWAGKLGARRLGSPQRNRDYREEAGGRDATRAPPPPLTGSSRPLHGTVGGRSVSWSPLESPFSCAASKDTPASLQRVIGGNGLAPLCPAAVRCAAMQVYWRHHSRTVSGEDMRDERRAAAARAGPGRAAGTAEERAGRSHR
jgi:hypothetical protein